MSGGEVHLLIVPNADRFHAKLKSEIENKRIEPVNVPIDLDDEKWKLFKDDVDRVDGTIVNLRVDVERREFDRLIEDMEKYRNTDLYAKMNIDTDDASKHLRAFEDEHTGREFVRHLTVDWAAAELELHEFERKMRSRPIQAPVSPVVPRGGGTKASKQIQKEMDGYKFIMGVRNPIEIDSSKVDTANFMSKLMTGMDRQLGVGLRQMYDVYFSTSADAVKRLASPMQMIRDNWTGKDDNGNYKNNTLSKFFSSVNSDARRAFGSIRKDGLGTFKALSDGVKESMGGFQAFIKAPGELMRDTQRAVKGLKSGFGADLRDAFGEVFYVMRALPGEARRMDVIFSRAINNGIIRKFGEAKKVTSDFAFMLRSQLWGVARDSSNVGKKIASELGQVALNNVYGVFKLLPSRVAPAFLGMGRLATRAVQNVGIEFLKMGDAFGKYFAPGIKGTAKLMTSSFGEAGKSVFGTLSRGWKAIDGIVPRAMSKMGKEAALGTAIVGDKLVRGFKLAGGRAAGALASSFGKVAGVAGKAASVVGRFAGPVGMMIGPILESTKIMSGLRKMVERLGGAFTGLMRVSVGAFSKLSGVLLGALAPAIKAVTFGLLAMGGQAVIGAIMAIGGAFGAVASGALLMLPATIGAVGASLYVLKVGTEGLKDAFSSAFAPTTAEEFEKAISGLPPQMQNIARSMREFQPMFQEMKRNVQENMFKDMAPKFNAAIGSMLPIFKAGAEKMATAWNGAIGNLLDSFSSPEAMRGMAAIMGGAVRMAESMQPVLGNLVKGFGSLAEQGAKFLGPFGQGLANATQNFANWTESLKEIDPATGESYFDGFIHAASRAAGLLKRIFGGLFGTILNVFRAGFEGGGGMLEGMASAMQRLEEHTSKGSKGFEQMVGFMKDASRFASVLGGLIAPVFSSVVSVLTTLINIGAGALPGVIQMVSGIPAALQPFEGIAEEFGKNIGGVLASFAPAIEAILGFAGPVVDGIGKGLNTAIVPTMEALAPAFKAMEGLGQPIGDLFVVVGEALSKIGLAAAPIINSLMSMVGNFLPIISKVAFWIGELGAKVINLLSPMLEMRDGAVKGLISELGPLVDIIGNGLMQVLDALSPLFEQLGRLLSGTMSAIRPLIPVIGQFLVAAFSAVVDVINWLMPFIPPLVDLIVNLLGNAINILVDIVKWFLRTWENVWPTVSAIIQFAVDYVLVPIISLLVKTFNFLGDVIQFVIKYIIVPMFNVMSEVFGIVTDAIEGLIENVLRPAFDKMGDWIGVAVDRIKGIWNGLKKVFAEPIKFFIETVINKGVVGSWNTVMGLINKEKDWGMHEVSVPASLNFNQGGVLPGMSVGRDNYQFVEQRTGMRLGLAGGEGILRQEAVSALGGKKGIDAINESARHGRLTKPVTSSSGKFLGEGMMHSMGGIINLGGLHAGGVVNLNLGGFKDGGGDLDERISRVMAALKPEHGKPYQYAGTGNPSWDCSGLWSGIVQELNVPGTLKNGRIFNTESDFSQFGFVPGAHGRVTIGVANGGGGPDSHMAGTIDGVNIESSGSNGVQIGGAAIGTDHPSFNAQYTLEEFLGEFVSGGMGGNGGGGFMSRILGITSKAKDLFGSIMDGAKSAFEQYGQYGKLGIGFGEALVGKIKDAAISKIKEIAPFIGGSGSYDGEGGISGQAESWRPMAMEAMRRNGFNADDPAQVDAMIRQIQSESGGIADRNQEIVDVNGTGASAGQGLLQIIPGTFAAHRDPELPDDRTDPWANMNAALRYYKSRYGNDLTTMWGQGHGYAKGGVVDFFDRGGVANGLGSMVKATLRPERVLSPDQTEAFNAFVYKFMPEMIRQFKDNPKDILRIGGDITSEISRVLHELREGRITRLQAGMADRLHRQLNGENLQDNPIDLKLDKDWVSRNMDGLLESKRRTEKAASEALFDPEAYIEAEDRAKKQVEEERQKALDEERKKREEALREERDTAKDNNAELKALNEEKEQLNKEISEAKKGLKTDAEKDAVDERFKDKLDSIDDRIREANKTISDANKAEDDARREQERKEDERIEKAKADGSYYYGYKTFTNEGKNPDEYTETAAETGVKGFLGSVGDRTGMGEAIGGMVSRYDTISSIGRAAQTAVPAWIAALNGDPSGLAHNIAAGQAQVVKMGRESVMDLGPEALAGIIEMAIANSNAGAPMIGTFNSGMSRAETEQTIEYFNAKRARKGTGTTRVR